MLHILKVDFLYSKRQKKYLDKISRYHPLVLQCQIVTNILTNHQFCSYQSKFRVKLTKYMIQAMMYFSSIAAIRTLLKQKLNMVHSFHHHLAEEYGYLERQLIFPFTAINQHDKLELPQKEFEDQHHTSSKKYREYFEVLLLSGMSFQTICFSPQSQLVPTFAFNCTMLN